MSESEPSKSRTWLASVVFVDIVGYSKQSVDRQMEWKSRFNQYLSAAIADVPKSERVIRDTGDGAAICFLGDPETAMFAALTFRNTMVREEAAQANGMKARYGINLGSVKLIDDFNGTVNVVGDGINVGQRVMSFAGDHQILVSRSFFEVTGCLSEAYQGLFTYFGVRTDKHVREHALYLLQPEPITAASAPEAAAAVDVVQTKVSVDSTVARVKAPALALDPALLDRIARELATHLGPVARLMVTRAATGAKSADELYQALADRIESSADRHAFLKSKNTILGRP